MFNLDLLLFGLHGISIWAVQMLWIPLLAAGVVNGLGHWWGYRNFQTADASTNLCPWGIVIGGEELHNNHHAFPSSARLSSRPWEFDIGWCYIRVLECLGLARVRKLAPIPTLLPEKGGVDSDTVRAIIRNHMHVMAHYARDVVAPVHRDEQRRASSPELRQILNRTRHLLLREESRLDDEALRHLQHGLTLSESLQVVYKFKQQLQALWCDKAATHEVLLQSLTDWCHQAEATGILALREFAKTLRCYTLQKV
jgi:stearoyl-CoA desaturase (delta-9 desaturase)